MPHLDDLAMQAIAARTRFVAKMQPSSASCQFLDQLAHMIRPVRDRPKVADLSAAFALRNRNRDRRLVDIKSDKRATLHLVSAPFLRLGARQPAATLVRRMPRERPQTQSDQGPIMGSSYADGVQPDPRFTINLLVPRVG